jgi:hypothetical protein
MNAEIIVKNEKQIKVEVEAVVWLEWASCTGLIEESSHVPDTSIIPIQLLQNIPTSENSGKQLIIPLYCAQQTAAECTSCNMYCKYCLSVSKVSSSH